MCQSVGNPSKLVIYLFVALLAPPPFHETHSLFHLHVLPLSSGFPLSPTYSSFIFPAYLCVGFRSPPLSLPPTLSKTAPLFISFYLSFTSLCSPLHQLLHVLLSSFPLISPTTISVPPSQFPPLLFSQRVYSCLFLFLSLSCLGKITFSLTFSSTSPLMPVLL